MGNNTQYFNPERIGKPHLLILYFTVAILLMIFIFEIPLIKFWRYCTKRLYVRCGKCVAKMNSSTYVEEEPEKYGFVFSDDLFFEFDFGYLYRKYKDIKEEKQRIKNAKHQGKYEESEVRLYINPYLEILDRNQMAIHNRLIELAEEHADDIDDLGEQDLDLDFEDMSDEQKIKACFQLYDRATNPDYPDRKKFGVSEVMMGRVMNDIQSYNYMENKKYQRIKQLLDIMKETFGYESTHVHFKDDFFEEEEKPDNFVADRM